MKHYPEGSEPPAPPAALPAHLHGLDALRGVAALAVVFWHWQHFFLAPGRGHVPGFSFDREPLAAVFGPLYSEGWRAVELFFCLSGFVFTWLYAGTIRRRSITVRRFAALRFSRLYPLHFVTLLLVAVAQAWMVRRIGRPFTYPWNDAYHFGLQLLFAGNWGFEHGDSFNGPTWSVSVEILLYVLFFAACRVGLRRWWQFAAIAAVGFAGLVVFDQPHDALTVAVNREARGVLSFFVGGLTFLVYRALWRLRPSARLLAPLGAAAAALWVVVPLNQRGLILAWWQRTGPHPAFMLAGHDVVLGVLWRVSGLGQHAFELLVFPLTILTVALWEAWQGPFTTSLLGPGALGRTLRGLGDLSYASYLIHFPLQLAFFGVALSLGLSRAVFYTPAALLLFFATLIPLSLFTYRGFELPAQRWLRTRLGVGSARTRATADAATHGGGASAPAGPERAAAA